MAGVLRQAENQSVFSVAVIGETSLMPQGLESALTEKQMADLVAYLRSDVAITSTQIRYFK